MTSTPPRWDLTGIYPGFSSDRFIDEMNLLKRSCEEVKHLAAEVQNIPDEELYPWFKELLGHVNMMNDLHENLESYAYTRYSSDTSDEEAAKGLETVAKIDILRKQAMLEVKRAFSLRQQELEELVQGHEHLKGYGYILRMFSEDAEHMMSQELEQLASELQLCGGDAWDRLHQSISSTASTLWDEESGERKSVTELRGMAFSPDRAIRKRAFELELDVWKQHEIPLAFALNGVKGTTNLLDSRRGYADPLEHAARQSRIQPDTLGTLISVIEDSLPLFREYLAKKARALGRTQLAFYDLFAPVGDTGDSWEFEQATECIIQQFTAFHEPMGAFARRAVDNRWIDARPARGKVGGAYCIHFPLARESRILCNFDGSFDSLSTVAHELGHAYHGHLLNQTPALLRDYPMTLAETASIFAESVLFNGVLSQADDRTRLTMIESLLKDCTQTLVDILSRFYFERDVFTVRRDHELSANELCELMISAQKRTYGPAIASEALHPYMWAVKGHYYSPDLSFYNYPYAFGQLFGMGLYSTYLKEGPSFCARYDALLASAGSESAEAVTASAGFDITDEGFWRSAIGLIRGYVDQFSDLVDSL